MDKPQYIKCPRCELNYILKKDKYCDVCKKEMKAGSLEDIDDEYLEDEELELCPICKTNYLSDGESICASCQEEHSSKDVDDDVDWRTFVQKQDEDDELDLLPIENDIDEELDNTFAKDLEEDEDMKEEDEDDEYVPTEEDMQDLDEAFLDDADLDEIDEEDEDDIDDSEDDSEDDDDDDDDDKYRN